jgi:hypothetical protein
MRTFLRGALDRFWEGVGGGIVIVIATALFIWLANKYMKPNVEPLFSRYSNSPNCTWNQDNVNCSVSKRCEGKNEVVVYGECIVGNGEDKTDHSRYAISLMNFGAVAPKEKKADATTFYCEWATAKSKPNFTPIVTAICIDKEKLKFSSESFQMLLQMVEGKGVK